MKFLIVVLAVLGLCSCDRALPVVELNAAAMGTTYSVQLVDPSPSINLDALRNEIQQHVERVEQTASTYRPDSELSRFNSALATDWITVSADLCQMIEHAVALGHQTLGRYDITAGPLVELWGFGAESAADSVPDPDRLSQAMQSVGFSGLETDCKRSTVRKAIADLRLDLSSLAKGHAVDEIARVLDRYGVASYLAEIGGELRMRGRNAIGTRFAIGIESPTPGDSLPTTILKLTNTSVATSGDYRNYFEHGGRKYSHIIDPVTGYPVDHALASVTVVAASTMRADALATALLVMGPETGYEYAADRGIAALFQIKSADGIEVRMTTALKRLTAI